MGEEKEDAGPMKGADIGETLWDSYAAEGPKEGKSLFLDGGVPPHPWSAEMGFFDPYLRARGHGPIAYGEGMGGARGNG